MPKSLSNGPAGVFASIVGLGLFLHMLHEAADGYEWAAQVALNCPTCRFLGRR